MSPIMRAQAHIRYSHCRGSRVTPSKRARTPAGGVSRGVPRAIAHISLGSLRDADARVVGARALERRAGVVRADDEAVGRARARLLAGLGRRAAHASRVEG